MEPFAGTINFSRADLRRGAQPFNIFEVLPTSGMQKLIWTQQLRDRQDDSHHRHISIKCRGPIDRQAFHTALCHMQQRHPALRTTFFSEGGTLLQKVHSRMDPPFTFRDLAEVPLSDKEAQTRRESTLLLRKPFDLREECGFRAGLLRLADDEWVVLFVFHGILVDDNARNVFLRGFTFYYRQFCRYGNLKKAPFSLKSPTTGLEEEVHLMGEQGENDLAFWQEQLNGRMTPVEWPFQRDLSGQGRPNGTLGVHSCQLPADLVRAADNFAHTHSVPLHILMLASFQVLLYRHFGSSGPVLGVRPPQKASRGDESPLGDPDFWLPMVPVAKGAMDFSELIALVHERYTACSVRQGLPYDRLIGCRGAGLLPAKNGCLQVRFGTREPMPGFLLADMRHVVEYPLQTARTSSDLTMTLEYHHGHAHPKNIRALFAFDDAVFTHADMETLSGRWLQLLGSCLREPGIPIGQHGMLAAREQERLSRMWSGPAVEYPDLTLHALIGRQCASTPDSPAVISEKGELTYRALDERSTRLACRLVAEGVLPDRPVAIFLERSDALMVAILAVLKAGAGFMPLEVHQPPGRLRMMLEDAGTGLLITDRSLPFDLPGGIRILHPDTPQGWEDENIPTPPLPETGPGTLAYVLYTSGSTGKPKGVQVEHRNIVNRLLYTRDLFRFGPDDRALQKSPLSFDVCITEFFLPLVSGGAVVMAKPERLLTPRYLADAIVRHRVTYIHFVATMLREFLQYEHAGQVNGILRFIRCGGESLTRDLMKECLKRLDARLYHSYGPAETAVAVTIWECRADTPYQQPPIGRPNANTQIHILNEYGMPVPPGVTGEIHIGGAQVGRGYLNNPDLTARKFIADPFSGSVGQRCYRTGDFARYTADGQVVFIGRADDQIKIRGQRVELREILHGLLRCSCIAQAAVVPEKESDGNIRLDAYIVASGIGAPAVSEIRNELALSLPDHMIPSRFLQVREIPRNINGKTDKAGLLSAQARVLSDRTGEGNSMNATETSLARIWEKLIGSKYPERKDHFLSIGGHSIALIKLVDTICVKWKVDIEVSELFSHLHLHEMAALIDRQRAITSERMLIRDIRPVPVWDPGQGRKVHVMVGGAGSLAEFAKYHRIGEVLGEDFSLDILPDPESVEGQLPEMALQTLAKKYARLILEKQSEGPYLLMGDCLGAIDAFATACELEKFTRSKVHVIMLDPPVPIDEHAAVAEDRVGDASLLSASRPTPLRRFLFEAGLAMARLPVLKHLLYRMPRDRAEFERVAIGLGLFDPAYYKARYLIDAGTDAEVLDHYLSDGWKKLYAPSPTFNAYRYAMVEDSFRIGISDPVSHAVFHGFRDRTTRVLCLRFLGKPVSAADIRKARSFLRLRNYSPERFGGDVHLVVSKPHHDGSLREGWRPFVGGQLRESKVQGDHMTYLRESLRETAQAIAMILRPVI